MEGKSDVELTRGGVCSKRKIILEISTTPTMKAQSKNTHNIRNNTKKQTKNRQHMMNKKLKEHNINERTHRQIKTKETTITQKQ